MKITVVAHPRSSVEKIEKVSERYYDVYFNVRPEKGRANKKIIQMLADFFNIPKSSISFYGGEKSKLKVFEIED